MMYLLDGKTHMKIFLIFLIFLGFTSFAYVNGFQPLPEDFRNDSEFVIDLSSIYDAEVSFPVPLAPFKQSTFGIITEDIKCKSKLHLIIKYDGTPVCVKSKTAVKITDNTSRGGWTPSKQLWEKLETQIYSISPSDSCPRMCITWESFETMDLANEKTNLQIDLPNYIPKNYEFFRFFAEENHISVQISPKLITENTTWNEFYLIDNGIFITYIDYPITLDGRAQVEYWAKNNDAKNISLLDDEPIYVRDRDLTYDENLDLLFMGYPSEAQFNIDDDISIIVVGYVSQEEIISISNSFFVTK